MIKKLVTSILIFICFFCHANKNDDTLKIDRLIHHLRLQINQKSGKSNYETILMHVKLSGLYNRINLYDSAYSIINRYLKTIKNLTPNEKVFLLSEKGNYYKNIGKDDKALECFHEADTYLSAVKLPCTKIFHALNKAEFYRKIANFTQAKNELGLAKNMMNKNGVCDSTLLTRFYHRMAAVMNETGEDSTVVYSLKSIENARRLNDLYSEAISFNELGYYYKNRRKIDTSMQCYLQAESKWKQYGSYTNAAHAMYNRALLIAHNNLSKKKSNTILKEIIKMQQANIINYQMDNVYDAIRDNYFFLGDSVNFFKYKILALEVRMNANVNRHEADIRKITEKYKNDSIRAEINSVSVKLEISEDNLKAKNTENKRAYIFLSILALLVLLIAFLLYRIFISNKVLKEKFKEKEALVQEIHHRVKNNLQFVNSIINMQTNTASSESEENVLKDISRRIRSMALVHEMLYNKNNEAGINIKNYLSELIKSIEDLSINLDKKVEFDLVIEDLNFDTSKATAIGMIVSELVSNSLKYAFSKTEKPRIKILLCQKSELEYEFIYKDNGIGLPQNYLKTNKLGMRLIDIFSRQINGTYTFENNEGLMYKLNFSKRIKKQ